jgi:hypothetical protein
MSVSRGLAAPPAFIRKPPPQQTRSAPPPPRRPPAARRGAKRDGRQQVLVLPERVGGGDDQRYLGPAGLHRLPVLVSCLQAQLPQPPCLASLRGTPKLHQLEQLQPSCSYSPATAAPTASDSTPARHSCALPLPLRLQPSRHRGGVQRQRRPRHLPGVRRRLLPPGLVVGPQQHLPPDPRRCMA